MRLEVGEVVDSRIAGLKAQCSRLSINFCPTGPKFPLQGGAQMSFSSSLFPMPTQLSTISKRLIHRHLCHKSGPAFSLPSNSLHLGIPPFSQFSRYTSSART